MMVNKSFQDGHAGHPLEVGLSWGSGGVHTPGPLKIWGRNQNTKLGGFISIGAANMHMHNGPSAYVATDADANLYAAAPALLEALTKIVDCYGVGSTPEQFCRNVTDFMEEGRAAIASARGAS